MTQDLFFGKTDDGYYDLSVEGGQFKTVSGYETAILVSFFTDSRGPISAIATPSRRRGWVGNITTADIGLELGSNLWRWDQERLTDATINDIVIEAEQSLQWLITRDMAQSAVVELRVIENRSATFLVTIITPEGREVKYTVLWRNTNDFTNSTG